MTDLTDRLHRAAEGPPPGFSAADVRGRVDRQRRRSRALATSSLMLVVVGASLVAARAVGDGDQDADHVATGLIGTTELTASPWILTAIGGGPIVSSEPEWLSFGPDGSIVGDGGCGPFVASWRWDDRALAVDGVNRRPDGCDRPDGVPIVATPELIADVLASDPVPSHSEITPGGLRLRSGTPDAAVPWIELTPFDDLDPVVDDSAITGRWFTAQGATLQIEEEAIDAETSCAAPAPWSLGADGLYVATCVSSVLGLNGAGPLKVRSYSGYLWLNDGERLAWMGRDIGSPPSDLEDLVGARWIVRSMPGSQDSTSTAWIELHDDGTVRGDNGPCGTFHGRWTLHDDVLTGYDLRGPETSSCSPPPLDLQADLGAGLQVGRPEGARDQLQLDAVSSHRVDTVPWVLRRIDRIGKAATADDVVGMWEGQDARGWGATFSERGTVEISASGCREVRPWSIADGVITIGELTDDACRARVVQLPLPGQIDARIEGMTLWLSAEGGVVSAVRLA